MKNLSSALEKIVREGYQKIAPEFAETRARGQAPKLDILLEVLPPQGKLLDIGCGSGRLVKFLNPNLDYLGLDPCDELLVLARKSHPKHQFQKGDFQDLSRWGKFDVVTSIAAFHHLPDKGSRLQALLEMKRTVKPQGIVVFSVWNFWGTSPGRRRIWKNLWHPQKLNGEKLPWSDLVFPWKDKNGQFVADRYYHIFRRCELRRLLRLAGAARQDYKLISDHHNYWIIWHPLTKR